MLLLRRSFVRLFSSLRVTHRFASAVKKICDMSVKAETDILDQSALLVFFVLMSAVLQGKETEKYCGYN